MRPALRLVSQNVGHARIDAPQEPHIAVNQFLAEGYKFLPVYGGFLVRKDKEADAMLVTQLDDLIYDRLGTADAIVAPEFPLRAERACERTSTRHIGNSHAHAQRNVIVFRPVQNAPVGLDGIQVLHGRRCGRGDHQPIDNIGKTLDGRTRLHPAAFGHRLGHLDHDLFALPAHDRVDKGRLGQNLPVHEGGVNAAEDCHRIGRDLLGHLQDILGLVDGRRDRRAADDIGIEFLDHLLEALVIDIVRHRIDEVHVVEAVVLQSPGQVRYPSRRPVAGDLGTSGVVVRMDEENAHERPPKAGVSSARYMAA
jgi:hypothetical protein